MVKVEGTYYSSTTKSDLGAVPPPLTHSALAPDPSGPLYLAISSLPPTHTLPPSTTIYSSNSSKYLLKFIISALTRVVQWDERHSAKQKVASLLLGQGTCLGCRLGPPAGGYERQPIDASLSH